MRLVPDRHKTKMNVDYEKTYSDKLRDLREKHPEDRAMELLVGGDFEAQGILEHSLLQTLGLTSTHCIVDVGCGSGRLAYALRGKHLGEYIGTDILPEALEFAQRKVARADWTYLQTTDSVIPIENGKADFVCFFSVLTHLQDEDCYRFLQEAKRVAKPGGKVVFTFLDFDVPAHWAVFRNSLTAEKGSVLNRFHSKATINSWADALGLKVQAVIDGSSPSIPLLRPIIHDDGRFQDGIVASGQSICVLQIPQNIEPPLSSPARQPFAEPNQIITADGHVVNMSVRGTVGYNSSPLLAGFSVHGNPRRVLIRGIGPTLSRFGVPDGCKHPSITIREASGIAEYKSYVFGKMGDARLYYTHMFSQAGAFPLDVDAQDAVLIATLPCASYNVALTAMESGVGLLEIYMMPVARFSADQIGTIFPHSKQTRP